MTILKVIVRGDVEKSLKSYKKSIFKGKVLEIIFRNLIGVKIKERRLEHFA